MLRTGMRGKAWGDPRRERGTVQQSPRVSTPHAEAIRSGSVRFMGVGSGARVRAGWIGEKKGQNPERTMNVQIAVWDLGFRSHPR